MTRFTDRPPDPIPDPKESQFISSRPLFDLGPIVPTTDLWLPDASPAGSAHEVPLLSDLDLPGSFRPIPAPPQPPYASPDIRPFAILFAAWAFNTQVSLLKLRARAYNYYRKEINAGAVDKMGQYRRACRLFREQAIRRDLPGGYGFDWKYDHPALPLFDIKYTFSRGMTPGTPDYEVISKITFICTVETIVRRHEDDHLPFYMRISSDKLRINDQNEWSSSSSSSSSSEFDDS